jgi:hypothetical protein
MKYAGLIQWLDREAIDFSFKPDQMRESACLYLAADRLRELQGLKPVNREAIENAKERFREYYKTEMDLPD